MKTRIAKITLLFSLYAIAHLVSACLWQQCDCPSLEFPYFDYNKIVLKADTKPLYGYFSIDIKPDSVEFLAQATPLFNLIAPAYGCSCAENGDEGDKYAPVSMDVFADRDFNDTLPAGASLRAVFTGQVLGKELPMLSPAFQPGKFNYYSGDYTIRTVERPKYFDVPYHFRIQWVKSNGDTLTAETDAVVFEP